MVGEFRSNKKKEKHFFGQCAHLEISADIIWEKIVLLLPNSAELLLLCENSSFAQKKELQAGSTRWLY